MADEKKFSAREAAIAVLAKAHEILFKTQPLNKAEKGVHASYQPKGGVSMEGVFQQMNNQKGGQKDAKYDMKPEHREKLKELKEMPKPNLTKSEQKGVHAPSYSNENDKGRSEAGDVTRMASHNKNFSSPTKKGLNNQVKVEHKNKLAELKAMPKPNLTKSENKPTTRHVDVSDHGSDSFGSKTYAVEHIDGSKKLFHADEGDHENVKRQAEEYRSKNLKKGQNDGDHAHNHAYNYDHMQAQKGVNKVAPIYNQTQNRLEHGTSEGGSAAKRSNGPSKAAVRHHKETLNELKAMPKPNLTKEEQMPVGEIHPKEQVQGEPEKPAERVHEQKAPEANPKEQAEGNNPEWGAEPGHYKLAKFCGHMSAKRKMRG